MAMHRRAGIVAVTVAAAAAAMACTEPSAAAPDPAQEAAGTYRLVLDSGQERTWELRPGCEPSAPQPCITVSSEGSEVSNAVFDNGRWSYRIPYPVNKTCSGPPITFATWSWDPVALDGTVVNHIAEGCGLPERDETSATFTLTRIS